MTLNISVTGTGQPLVLFHGWGFDHRVWDALSAVLSHRFRLYAVDLPGFGRSDRMDWAEFKHELLQVLPDQFALAGWSLGGLYATRLALEASTRVTHVLNIASSPRFVCEDTDDWPGISPTVLDDFFANLMRDPLRVRAEFIALQAPHQAMTDELSSLPSTAGLKDGLEVLAHWDLRADLANLTMPVGYMFGRLDAIVPRRIVPVMQARYPHCDYVLFPRAAHMPFMTHQADFIHQLERFLAL